MASSQDTPAPQNLKQLSQLKSAQVQLTTDNQLRVQFNINELLTKVAPASAETHCSGCLGCMGCKV